MPALSLDTVVAGDLDFKHIADLATSPLPEATDRLGQTKLTWSGLLANLNADAAVTATLAGRDAAQAAQAAAETAQGAAEDAVAQAETAAGGMYPTLAAGEAAVPTVGRRYLVRSADSQGAYEEERTATGSIWRAQRVAGTKAREVAYARVVLRTLAPPAAGLSALLCGLDAVEWDGRVIPNRLAATLPTLNAYPGPFDPADELGSTPTREVNTPATLDPMGTSYALKLTATAQSQQLTLYRSAYGAIRSDTYRFRAYFKTLGGGANWRMPFTTSADIVTPAAWPGAPVEVAAAAYTGATDAGISSSVGNVDGQVAVAAVQVYDSLGGESAGLPTAAQELAAQKAGHLKPAFSVPGQLRFGRDYALQLDGAAYGAAMIDFDPAAPAYSRYAFGGAMECTVVPTAAYGNFMSWDFHGAVTGGATNTYGQLGVDGAGGGVGRVGILYGNPILGTLLNKSKIYVVGQGRHTFYVSVVDGDTTFYFNRIPMPCGVMAGFAAPRAARISVGAYNGTSERRKTANPLVGAGDCFAVKLGAGMSQADVSAQDAFTIAAVKASGGRMGLRKAAVFGCCDSTTAFSPSYWWHLGDCPLLNPRSHLFLEAVGGTDLSNWTAEPRLGNLKAQIAAAAETYDCVLLLMRPWTNETDDFIAAGYSYAAWLVDYLAYTDSLKAVAPDKVKLVFITASVRLSLGDEVLLEQLRYAYNDDWRANYKTLYRHDYLWDMGLGTERLNPDGLGVTPEAIPGGRVMADYRFAKGCIDAAHAVPDRIVAVQTLLDATAGAAIHVTTNPLTPGTFTMWDKWKKFTGNDAGFGRIEAIDADGSGCTVNTSTVAPVAWAGEDPACVTRDTVTRAAFLATVYAAGSSRVAGLPEYFQGDAIHQTNAGGRDEANFAYPKLQAIQDQFSGVL